MAHGGDAKNVERPETGMVNLTILSWGTSHGSSTLTTPGIAGSWAAQKGLCSKIHEELKRPTSKVADSGAVRADTAIALEASRSSTTEAKV